MTWTHEELEAHLMRTRKRERKIRERKTYTARQWAIDHPERTRETNSRSYANLRLGCLQHYCGSVKPFCMCPGCRETTIQFLGIDHIDGGGNKHRKEIGNNGIYYWLRSNNYPPDFQVLCHNCNLAKGSYGRCPHEHNTREFDLVAVTSLLD